MNIEAEFSGIILQSRKRDLVPFLRSLSPAEKRSLAATIKKFGKDYNVYRKQKDGSWGYNGGNDTQREMLQVASFVCHNQADYEKSIFGLWYLHKEQLNDLISWHVPDWFSNYVNKAAAGDTFSLDYHWIIELSQMGALQPSPEVVVNALPKIIYECKDKKYFLQPAHLFKHPITLEEHIWYLFDFPSNLHYSNRFLYFGENVSKLHQDWHHVFKLLVQEGRLERPRVLREALLATNKNFNKVLSGWFADLFVLLEPSTNELLSLQKELVSVIQGPQSKPAAMALQYLRSIIDAKETDVPALLDALPVVLSAGTRGLVNAALQWMEQIAKKQATYHHLITQLACGVFIHPDEALQLRAAKLIGKWGDPADETLRTQLAAAGEGILQTPRRLLAAFFDTKPTDKTTEADAPGTGIAATADTSPEPIPAIDTIDDLLFLAAQAFDNNESFHFDLLPAALVRMQHQLQGPVLSQLQPALQRALRIVRSGTRSNEGDYDQLLAVFFIDVCIHLLRKHPADAGNLQQLFTSYAKRTDRQAFDFLAVEPGSIYTPGWQSETKEPLYNPGKQLLIEALQKIQQGDDLPLLSTPTHRPGWLSADAFVDRWVQYKKKGALAAYTDMQLAIARCRLVDTDRAVARVKQELDGELQRLLLFLLQPGAEPQPPFGQSSFWIMAALSQRPKKRYAAFEELGYYTPFEKYTGQFPWHISSWEQEITEFDRLQGKAVKKKITQRQLHLDFPWQNKNGPDKKSLAAKLLKKRSAPPPEIIYDHFRVNTQFIHNEKNDIRRALLMAPNNVEPLLAQVMQASLRHPSWLSEDDKRFIIVALQTLYELWDVPGEMGYSFLAACLLCADKTAAGIAAETWLKYAPAGKIDNAVLGRILGIFQSHEYAPLKRFTDLVTQSLFRVSPQHNQLLQEMLEHLVVQLPDEPVKGLKKVWELLSELVVVNGRAVAAVGVREKLVVWKEVEGLRKVVLM